MRCHMELMTYDFLCSVDDSRHKRLKVGRACHPCRMKKIKVGCWRIGKELNLNLDLYVTSICLVRQCDGKQPCMQVICTPRS